MTDADILSCIEVLDRRNVRGGDHKSDEFIKSKAQGCAIDSPAKETSGKSSHKMAEMLGTSARKVEQTRTVLAEGVSPEIKQAVLSGEKSINKASEEVLKIKKASQTASTPTNDTDSSIIDLDALADSGKKFGCVYIDPPWKYLNQSKKAPDDNHSPAMTLEEIIKLPVGVLAENQSHLHIWATDDFLHDALHIIEEWGFDYKGVLVWVKTKMGRGDFWKVSHEFLLLGIKGDLKFNDRDQVSWLNAGRPKHGEKPAVVREIIQKVSPGPYLELFARKTCEGWTTWENQIQVADFVYRETA